MLLDDKAREVGLVTNILNTLLLLGKHVRVYAAGNRLLDLTSSRLVDFLDAYFLYHERLNLTVVRHGFMYEDELIERTNKGFEQFAYGLFQHGVSSVTFEKGLAQAELQTFLRLTSRPAAESWEEGGIVSSLRMRNIEKIRIREMAESDIALKYGLQPETREEALRGKSTIWERFARAVYHGLSVHSEVRDGAVEDAAPGLLAQLTVQVFSGMSEGAKQQFAKGVGNFLTGIQGEKIVQYRRRALAKLTDFINRINPEIRKRLFNNIFNLNLQPQFAEEFCDGLSDEALLEILESSLQDNQYVPPVVLKLLGKIARNRALEPTRSEDSDRMLSAQKDKIAKLFQRDAFEKYVPDHYRQALVNIIQNDSIPTSSAEGLQSLRQTLEDTRQERHSANIILKILEESADPRHLKGLDYNLVNIVELYLGDADYHGLIGIWELCTRHGQQQEPFNMVRRTFSRSDFTERLVAGCALHDKSKVAEFAKLVSGVGTPFITPLLERLAAETSRNGRMNLLKLLQQLDTVQIIPQAARYLNDQRWYFVRNLILLLRTLNNKLAMPHIKPLTLHPHPKVQLEAARACLQFGCPDSRQNLLQMLTSRDPQKVDMAISLAAMVQDPAIFEKMSAMLRETAILDFRLERKKAIVKVLAQNAPEFVLPVFAEVLMSSNLIHAAKLEALKDDIIRSMGHFDQQLLKPILVKMTTGASDTLKIKLQPLYRRVGVA